jgi:hypothetical protein
MVVVVKLGLILMVVVGLCFLFFAGRFFAGELMVVVVKLGLIREARVDSGALFFEVNLYFRAGSR